MNRSKMTLQLNQQKGAVLIVCMLLLLVMTIIGVTATSTTVTQERMSGNNLKRASAFQSASAALRDAEAWLTTNITTVAQFETVFTGTPDELFWVRQPAPGDAMRAVTMNIYDGYDWTVGNSQVAPSSVIPTGQTQQQPRYIIEYMGRIGEAPLDYTRPDTRDYAFRVTTIGWGPDNTTTFVTQSSMRLPLL